MVAGSRAGPPVGIRTPGNVFTDAGLLSHHPLQGHNGMLQGVLAREGDRNPRSLHDHVPGIVSGGSGYRRNALKRNAVAGLVVGVRGRCTFAAKPLGDFGCRVAVFEIGGHENRLVKAEFLSRGLRNTGTMLSCGLFGLGGGHTRRVKEKKNSQKA